MVVSHHAAFESAAYSLAVDRSVKLLVTFALKSSESTFKPQFVSLLKWSKLVQDYEATSDDLMQRKLAFLTFVDFSHLDSQPHPNTWQIRRSLFWLPL